MVKVDKIKSSQPKSQDLKDEQSLTRVEYFLFALKKVKLRGRKYTESPILSDQVISPTCNTRDENAIGISVGIQISVKNKRNSLLCS